MSRTVRLLLLSVFLIFAAVQAAAAQVAAGVAKIRREVAEINQGARKYAKVVRDVEDISLEGCEATYYFSGKTLKKIASSMLGETYQATGEFSI